MLTLLYIAVLLSCGKDDSTGGEPAGDVNLITYTASTEVISNPERGFMHLWSVAPEGTPLNLETLNGLKSENVTLINRLYYLDTFKNSSLSTTQLELISTDFERLRTAGIKCILRFAYNSDSNDMDAPLSVIETHLEQLRPIFQVNSDVIAFVQAGFIGSWGEWYYSSNDLTTIENKRAVLFKLLEVLPETIKVQVRTPLYKQEIFDYAVPIGSDVGYGTTDIARIGFHNDCFLGSSNDYGTYQNVDMEKEYISKEALFVPTGGETCPPTDVPFASCSTAESEMAYLKWTYLNLDYYGPVLQEWRNNNCFGEFQKRLGYRLALKKAVLKNEASANTNFNLYLVLDNTGFAPVYNRKRAYLVFKSNEGVQYKKPLEFDVRRVIPIVNYELNESVNLADIPAGKYELFLKLQDASESLTDRPDYSIQLANYGTWDSTTGMNRLQHTLIVN